MDRSPVPAFMRYPCTVQPAVFLDRDNTLIHNEGDLGDPEHVRLVDGVAAGLLALRRAGYRLVVVTNQAGVARGRYTEADVDAVHQRIAQKLAESSSPPLSPAVTSRAQPGAVQTAADAAAIAEAASALALDELTDHPTLIDRFYYCPYHPEGVAPEYRRDHPWRKPNPGMLLQAAEDMHLDLARSWMIGDQQRDVLAGRAAGCRTILLRADARAAETARPTATASDFNAAVEIILKNPAMASSGATAAIAPVRNASPAPAATTQHAPATATGVGTRGRAKSQVNAGAIPARPAAGPSSAAASAGTVRDVVDAVEELRRSVNTLADDLRSDRVRRSEFTPMRMAAGLFQLLAVLLAVLGLMQIANDAVFLKWMLGAGLVQLFTIALLVFDTKS